MKFGRARQFDGAFPKLDGIAATRTYKYNNQGNLSEKTDREGRKTTYVYDLLDRKLSETWYTSPTESFVAQEWEYDGLNRVWFSRDGGSGSDVITHTEYDDLGRVITEAFGAL